MVSRNLPRASGLHSNLLREFLLFSGASLVTQFIKKLSPWGFCFAFGSVSRLGNSQVSSS